MDAAGRRLEHGRSTAAKALALFATAVLSAVAWLLAFPHDPQPDLADIVTESSYVLAAAVAFPLVMRWGVRTLELGWAVFALSLWLEMLDEWTTAEGSLADTVMPAVLGCLGLVLIARGFRTAFEAQQRTARERAGAVQAKDDLLSIVAHDFRSPLTVIDGYVQVLLERSPDPEARRMLEIVSRQTQHLAALAADVLTMSRMEAGGLELQLQRVDLAEVARQVADTHQGEGAIAVSAPEPAWVQADPLRLTEVVDNLVANAVKYSPPPVRVELSVRTGPGGVELSVRDQGYGMTEEEIGSLFQKFRRLDSARLRQIPGTGLGLYICRLLVEAQGGQIGASSVPGRGSTFHVRLPAAPGG